LSQFAPRLARLGWDSDFEQRFLRIAEAGDAPARVIADHGADYLVHDGALPRHAPAASWLRERNQSTPAVGDWVAVQRREPNHLIRAVVDRRTALFRKAVAAESKPQNLTANVDVVFVVAAAPDVNLRRVERYLTIAWQSGASPVVLLTKADATDAGGSLRQRLETVSMGTPVIATSGVTGEGVGAMAQMLRPARTAVLLGPSGAGKSTLINHIVGDTVMRTRDIHRSGEGRHMTSHRQLVQIPGGGMIIDTPGLREAQLWAGEDALAEVFDDIERLAADCRFTDCDHRTEPGCAVAEAIAEGALDRRRLESYRKLQRELRAVAAKGDARLRRDERRKWKRIATENRARERYLRR